MVVESLLEVVLGAVQMVEAVGKSFFSEEGSFKFEARLRLVLRQVEEKLDREKVEHACFCTPNPSLEVL